MRRKTRTPEARFWAKVRVADAADPDACWLWTGALDRDGYGQFWVAGRQVKAHRFAYELLVGPIPDGLQGDHQCHNRDKSCKGGPTCLHRRCVNSPDHLEPASGRDNTMRGDTITAGNASKTHCPVGHPYSSANTRVRSDGGRDCRACKRARKAAYRASGRR